MSHRASLAFVFIVLSLSLAACGKRHDLQTVSTYKFTNTLNERVNLDLYENRDDYSNGGRILNSYQIEPGATASIPLQALKTYWIDWYSKDYSLNNWGDSVSNGNVQGIPGPKIAVASEDDHLFISSFTRDTSRSILLNGNGISSMWKITIDTEPALNGTHTFLFKKDLAGQYTFTDPVGRSDTISFSYFISNFQQSQQVAGDFRIDIINNGPDDEFAFMDFRVSRGPTFSRGRDSLMTTFRGFSEQYWAKRQ